MGESRLEDRRGGVKIEELRIRAPFVQIYAKLHKFTQICVDSNNLHHSGRVLSQSWALLVSCRAVFTRTDPLPPNEAPGALRPHRAADMRPLLGRYSRNIAAKPTPGRRNATRANPSQLNSHSAPMRPGKLMLGLLFQIKQNIEFAQMLTK